MRSAGEKSPHPKRTVKSEGSWWLSSENLPAEQLHFVFVLFSSLRFLPVCFVFTLRKRKRLLHVSSARMGSSCNMGFIVDLRTDLLIWCLGKRPLPPPRPRVSHRCAAVRSTGPVEVEGMTTALILHQENLTLREPGRESQYLMK